MKRLLWLLAFLPAIASAQYGGLWSSPQHYNAASVAITGGTISGLSSPIGPADGGTGIANNAAATLTRSGNDALTLTTTGATGVTLPTSGTLYGTATGSITSAQLAASVTNETGTGAAVFGTSPTFTTGANFTTADNVALNFTIGVNTGTTAFNFKDENATQQYIMGYRDSDNTFRILAGTSLANNTGIVVSATTGALAVPSVASVGAVTSNSRYLTEIVCISGAAVSAPADTSEDTLYTCTIPANSVGPNGQIVASVGFAFNATANSKTVKFRYSGGAGTVMRSQDLGASSAVWNSLGITIQNVNATNSQWVRTSVDGSTANAAVTSAVDTTASSTLVITCQKAVAGDTCTLKSILVQVNYGATLMLDRFAPEALRNAVAANDADASMAMAA